MIHFQFPTDVKMFLFKFSKSRIFNNKININKIFFNNKTFNYKIYGMHINFDKFSKILNLVGKMVKLFLDENYNVFLNCRRLENVIN